MIRSALASLGLGLRLSLAWRLDVLTRLLSGAVVLVLTGTLWMAVTDGRSEIAGRPGPELVAYAVMAWVVARVSATSLDAELGERTRTGDLVHDLLRPGSLILHLWARDAGRALIAVLTTAVPLAAAGVLLFDVGLPHAPGAWLAAGLSLALAHAVGVGLALCVGALGMRVGRADGLVHAKGIVVALLSGALVPLDVYPGSIRGLARLLPFAALADAPADLLVRGVALGSAMPVLAGQAAWALGLLALATLGIRRVQGHAVTRGG